MKNAVIFPAAKNYSFYKEEPSAHRGSFLTRYGAIHYALKRSSTRKTLLIGIDDKARVRVCAPTYTPQAEILAFMQDRSLWIEKKILEAQERKKIIERRSFVDGGTFLFLGKEYPLRVVEKDVKRPRIFFSDEGWEARIVKGFHLTERQECVKRQLVQWYRAQAQEILGGRIFHYARVIGCQPAKIAVRTQKRVWGNCDARTRVIHLNWQIILAPLSVIDYVVVHELCHLEVPDHSKRFWAKVEKFFPGYQEQKQWLKKNYLNMLLP